MASKYKYLNGSQVYIYPSANSDDRGDVNSEGNLKTLFGSAVGNFVIRDSGADGYEPFYVEGSTPATMFYLNQGAAVVDGHYISIETTLLNLAEFVSATGYVFAADHKTPHLVLSLFKDSTGNARGDLLEGTPGDYKRIAKGVGFTLTDMPEDFADSIDIGVIEFNSTGGSIVDFIPNESSYKYINVNSINDYFVCETSSDDSDKTVKGLPELVEGTRIHVKFDGNVVDSLTLNSLPVYIACRRRGDHSQWTNGMRCPWSAIYPSNFYEFVYTEETIYEETLSYVRTYIPCWVLVNPASPVLGCEYSSDGTTASSGLKVWWSIKEDLVTGYLTTYTSSLAEGDYQYVPYVTLGVTESPKPLPTPSVVSPTRTLSFAGVSSDGNTYSVTFKEDNNHNIVLHMNSQGPDVNSPVIIPFTYTI